jgi:hypothetical protein
MKKEALVFQKSETHPKNARGAQTSNEKRDLGVSKIKNTLQKRKGLNPLIKKETSVFQKS